MGLKIKFLIPVVVTLCTLFSAGKSVAQDSAKVKAFTDGVSVGFQGHYGFIMVHRDNMSHLVKGHVPAFELSLEKQTSGLYDWNGVYNFPSIGVALSYADLGNKDQLGSGTAVFGFVNFPIIRKEKFNLKYRFGSGIGHISEPFDREFNHKNTAIGSEINLFIQLQFQAKFRVSKKLGVITALSLSHFSNGSYKVPNLGLNIMSMSVGMTYDIGDYELADTEKVKKKHDKGLDLNIEAGFAVREVYPVGQSKFGALLFTVEGTRRVDRRRKLGIGLDGFFDESNMIRYNRDTLNVTSNNQAAFIRYGVHFSHELVIGRFSAITQMGVYLYTKYKKDGLFYHRFTSRYQISEHIYLVASCKTHWAVAQYISFGVGYKF